MNMQHIIFSTLGLGILPACLSSLKDPCDGYGGLYDFSFDNLEVSNSYYDNLWNLSAEDGITCEELCEAILSYEEDGDIYDDQGGIDSCETDINLESLAASGDDTAGESVSILGTITCAGTYTTTCPGGRRPLGHVDHCGDHEHIGQYFSDCAYMERASVDAFAELAKQLRCWGGPAELQERCIEAAKDECNHAMIFDALAKREGFDRLSPQVELTDDSLLTVAIHNAVEGCVNEAWAALLATHQSQHAGGHLRDVYAIVAKDEIRHAQLAWDLHRWFLSQLSETEQQIVLQAQKTALQQLVNRSPEVINIDILGLPDASDHHRYVSRFMEQLAA